MADTATFRIKDVNKIIYKPPEHTHMITMKYEFVKINDNRALIFAGGEACTLSYRIGKCTLLVDSSSTLKI